MRQFRVLPVFLAILLAGWVTISSGPVQTTKLLSINSAPRELTVLNLTPYLGEMTMALTKKGFKVKQMASQETVIEKKSETVSTQTRIASSRYGIVFQVEKTRQVCAFTDYYIVNATVNVIDIRTNESVAILKQRGSDGPCTTVTPVFDSLADGIAQLWN